MDHYKNMEAIDLVIKLNSHRKQFIGQIYLDDAHKDAIDVVLKRHNAKTYSESLNDEIDLEYNQRLKCGEDWIKFIDRVDEYLKDLKENEFINLPIDEQRNIKINNIIKNEEKYEENNQDL